MSTGLHALLERKEPSKWSLFLSNPIVFLAKTLYSWRKIVEPPIPAQTIVVACISDTHNSQPNVPEGDILLHAGDLTQSGSQSEIQATVDWLNTLPHEHKVVIAGNHDLLLDPEFKNPKGTDCTKSRGTEWGSVIYLKDSSVILPCSGGRKLKIYGSPQSPRNGNWAFQFPRTYDVWRDAIPPDTDILITHGPPKGHLDLSSFGCGFLLAEIWRLKSRPRLHVFGHVHEGYGQEWAMFDGLQRAYDDIMQINGGGLKLFRLVYEFILSYLRPTQGGTLMINAAMVGGLRDEKRRQPVVVHI